MTRDAAVGPVIDLTAGVGLDRDRPDRRRASRRRHGDRPDRRASASTARPPGRDLRAGGTASGSCDRDRSAPATPVRGPSGDRRRISLRGRAARRSTTPGSPTARFDRDRAAVVVGLSKGDVGSLARLHERLRGRGRRIRPIARTWLDAWPHAAASAIAAAFGLAGPVPGPGRGLRHGPDRRPAGGRPDPPGGLRPRPRRRRPTPRSNPLVLGGLPQDGGARPRRGRRPRPRRPPLGPGPLGVPRRRGGGRARPGARGPRPGRGASCPTPSSPAGRSAPTPTT